MPLRAYIESFSQYDNKSLDDQIETGRTKLFDFDYPFFDQAKKKDFETDFILNFYTREIGFETESLFKFALRRWLKINMPYWNKMFQSELIEFDPLKNSENDVTHGKTNTKNQKDNRDSTQNSTIDGTGHSQGSESHNDHATTGNDTTGTIKDDGFTRDLQSDTPDNRLAITTNEGSGVIEYASKINESKPTNTRTLNTHVGGNNDSNGGSTQTTDTTNHQGQDVTGNDKLTSDINEQENFTQHREGKIGVQSYSKMLTEYRQTFLRLEREIFAEMNELFMLVY